MGINWESETSNRKYIWEKANYPIFADYLNKKGKLGQTPFCVYKYPKEKFEEKNICYECWFLGLKCIYWVYAHDRKSPQIVDAKQHHKKHLNTEQKDEKEKCQQIQQLKQ